MMRFVIWVSSLAVICCTQSAYYDREGVSSEDIDISKNIEQKRSVNSFLNGIKALKQLVAGATFVPSQSKYYTKYVKQGDIKMAYRDFYATNPEMVSEDGYKGVKLLHGIVGDREIVLRDPTNSPSGTADGIIYIDLINTKVKRKIPPGRVPRPLRAKGRYKDRVVYINKKF